MKKNPGYESVLIISNQLTDEELQNTVEKFAGVISANGGEIVHSEEWGRKKLSYPIKKINHGYYHLYFFKGGGATVKELSLQSSYDDKVLRCFTSSVDDLDAARDSFLELKNDPQVNLNKFLDAQNKRA